MVYRLREKLGPGRVDRRRLLSMTEEEIRRTSPPELADLPDDFWKDAVVVAPLPKEPISLRVDEDVLIWFRMSGRGYQTRMNAVLRRYMEAMAAQGTKKPKRRSRATK